MWLIVSSLYSLFITHYKKKDETYDSAVGGNSDGSFWSYHYNG